MEKGFIYTNQNRLVLKRKSKYSPYPESYKEFACKYYLDNNLPLAESARRIGINRLTLKSWLEERDVFENDFDRLQKFNHKDILTDIDLGMKGVEIAKKHGCSESLVSAIRNGRR